MHITMRGMERDFPEKALLSDIIKTLCPDLSALGAICNGKVIELNQPVSADCGLEPLTLQHEEGRRIMERTLRHVMLQAVHKLYRHHHVRIEYSVGQGVLVIMPGKVLNPDQINLISAEMGAIIRADLPIIRETWPREKLLRYYVENGELDKV